jgi:hypothetical protein
MVAAVDPVVPGQAGSFPRPPLEDPRKPPNPTQGGGHMDRLVTAWVWFCNVSRFSGSLV